MKSKGQTNKVDAIMKVISGTGENKIQTGQGKDRDWRTSDQFEKQNTTKFRSKTQNCNKTGIAATKCCQDENPLKADFTEEPIIQEALKTSWDDWQKGLENWMFLS